MNQTETLTGNTPVSTTAPAKAPRPDLYGPIHKALRAFMSHTLVRLGAMDVADPEERTLALDGADALLMLMRGHLQHENDFVHTAIEARRPGASRRTADDHLGHLDAIANLEDEIRALRDLGDGRAEQRALQAARLYRHLAEFVGENLVHMQIEEADNNAALWALYSDAELAAIHDRLLASVAPAEMALVVRWMATSLSPLELCELFGEMRAKAPPPAFEALLDIARSQLDERRWARLTHALGRPPVHGLMSA